tara:strand:- start:13 stop:885 length:873 start_codon:yes stop_codon:yes gene_type:complete
MKIRALANTGIELSCVGLGEMPLSLSTRPDDAQAISVVHAAVDAGMTWIDTADVYCADHRDIGHGERLVTTALKAMGDFGKDIVIATKGGLERPGGNWTVNGHPDHLHSACAASLRSLETDCITWYQLHATDPKVHFTESVGALARLQEEGKIQHVGLSNVGVAEIQAAREIVNVVSVQNRCNPFDRDSFNSGVVAFCTRENIAFLPHSPVGGHKGHIRTPEDSVLCAVGARHGISPYQVCIAWLLALSPMMLPIPGASRIESARSSAAAAATSLTQRDMEDLARAFPTV